MSALDRIKKQVEESPVILYMKGTPQMPMCGFSARTVEALKSCGKEFAYVNVILDSEIMQELPNFADWPTFNSTYIDKILKKPNEHFTNLNGNELWHFTLLERWLQLNIDR